MTNFHVPLRKSLAAGLLPVALLIGSPGVLAADKTLAEISACVQANSPQSSLSNKVSMQSFDRGGGSRTLQGKIYARENKGSDQLMIAINSPQDLNGVRYLIRELKGRDDMQMYLPALNRTRRISGSQMNETALFGTDFSYEDIKQLSGSFAKGSNELLGEVEYEGRQSWKLKLLPTAEEESAYTEIISWVDKETCTILATDFVVGEQGVVKKMTANIDSVKQAGNRWYIGEYRMEDIKAGTHTILQTEQVEFDEKLSPRLFSPQTFQSG